MTILPIPRDCVAFAWNDLRKYVESACRHGGDIPNKRLRSLCMNDPDFSLFAISCEGSVTGCMITERGDRTLHVVSLAGTLPNGWRHHAFEFLCGIAKKQGARRITLKGRRGWYRYIRDLGFKPSSDGLLEVTL